VIYNRWGELIFESNNHMSYWDGTYGNKICPIGMYTYKVRFGDPKTDGKYMITGNVNLIR
jgi:gliding motility-associated-like protein